MATSKWNAVRNEAKSGGQLHAQFNTQRLTTGKNLRDLHQIIGRFNTIAQKAYDNAVLRQRLGIAGTISAKFAKATLKEVVSNAIGTFGPGALTDVVFGDVAVGGGSNYADGWNNDNLVGKGFDYALGDKGGYMELGSSGMSRLSENAIKAGIGWATGLLQGHLEDAVCDKLGGQSDSDKVQGYIDSNVNNHQSSGTINGARQALLLGLPDLRSADSTVNMSTLAHQAKEREGSAALIKEVVHQIDQLCYAINELDAMDKASTTWNTRDGTFRKCREMVEFMGKMYWFRRKYNKTRHFMNKLKEDYVAIGLILEDMEKFWRENSRAMELLAMRAAAKGSGNATFGAGKRVHMATDLLDHGGASGSGAVTSGTRNWRKVT